MFSLWKKIRKVALSIFLILIVFNIFNFSIPQKVSAASASIFLSPASGTYKAGATVTTSIYVNSGGVSINAVEATVNYSPDYLRYVSFSTIGSIFSFWTLQPSATSTFTTFGGGLADPGYTGSSGKILTITWKAVKAGSAAVSVSGARVLANDGEGTNIFGSSGSARYTISDSSSPTPSPKTPAPPAGPSVPTLKSTSHTDQNAWSTKKNVSFSWTPGRDNTGYYYSFNKVAQAEPSIDKPTTETKKTYENVEDGIWYFHLKAKTAKSVVSTVHFKVQIDTAPPKEFTVSMKQTGGLTNPKPIASFDIADDTSGIKKIEAKVDNDAFFAIKSGDALPFQHPGSHTIIIKAYDNAGNQREGTATFRVQGINPPIVSLKKTFYSLLDPICFTGYAAAGDTVYISLDDKEAGKFIVNDNLLKNKSLIDKSPSGEIDTAWQYCYRSVIMPGNHVFRFSRINKDTVESEPTAKFIIKIEAATIKLRGYIFPMIWVLFLAAGLLFVAFLIILALLIKIRRLAVKNKDKFIPLVKWFKNTARFTTKVEGEIEKIIPERELTKKEVEEVKDELKKDIEKIEKEFDKEVEEGK